MEIDIYDDDDYVEDNADHLEKEDEKELGGFIHFKDVNTEWYSPFLNTKKEWKTVSADPTIIKEVEFMNSEEFETQNWNTWTHGPYSLFKRNTKEAVGKLGPMKAGVYEYTRPDSYTPERFVVRQIQRQDAVVPLGDIFQVVQRDINKFLEKRAVYESLKTPYKMAQLYYGPPGNGKSICIQELINSHKDAIVIYMDPTQGLPSNLFLERTNKFTKDQTKIFIFEELTTSLKPEYVNWFLRFLDADISMENTIVIATTNYPELLPENIINRPSRFDDIFEFSNPSREDRAKLLASYLQREPTEEDINSTDKFSVAEVKQFCIFMQIQDLTAAEALKRIKDRKQRCKSGKFQQTQERAFGL